MKKKLLAMAVVLSGAMISFGSCSSENGNKQDNAADTVSVGKSNPGQAISEGDLCSVVKDSTGRSFGVVKILKIEGDTYHIRTYGVSYDKRPAETDLKDIKPNHPAGIGHLPLSKEQFMQWKPEVIVNQPVSLEELEGYNIWSNGQK